MVSITAQELSEILELRKLKAELIFKKDYLIWKGNENPSALKPINSKLSELENKLLKLENKLEKIDFILPDQEKLNNLNQDLENMEKEEIFEAMKNKEGEVYEILKQRGFLLKRIYEKKSAISKLIVLLNKLEGKEKEMVHSFLNDSSSFSEEELSTIKDENSRKELIRLFARLDYSISKDYLSSDEARVVVASKELWVPSSMVEKISQMNKDMVELSRKIQYENAKKQIRTFSPKEDEDFLKMQNQYLSMLKEQDKLIHDFSEE